MKPKIDFLKISKKLRNLQLGALKKKKKTEMTQIAKIKNKLQTLLSIIWK